MAGLGNVYRNEICFLRGIHPKTPTHLAGNLDAIVDLSFRTINVNKSRRIRVTTGDTRPGRQTWVYGRRGKPCRRCGTRITEDTLGPDQLTERNIFFCRPAQLHAWLALISSLTQWRTNRSRSTTIVPSR